MPLFIGRATAADPQLGGPGSEAIAAWEQAMALGMTHLHLRFEACSDEDRAAEVEDLAAVLRPPLNERDDLVAGPEDNSPAGAELEVAEIQIADVAVATAPQLPAGRARRSSRGSWFGRTAAVLAARYHQWRLRIPAIVAEAPAGRVTVRADAIAVQDPEGTAAPVAPEPTAPAELPLTLAIEPPAAPLEPMPAEPAVAVETGGEDARSDVRQRLGLGSEDIVVLFAGEICWATGADLAVEAMATVHTDPAAVRLLLVGEGPLRGELEGRASNGGFAHACRLLGDLPAERFAEVFAACDAVVIPARVGQNPMLAEHSLSASKPVLTTQQAQLGCVRHGENGLVTYDNPGSLVWGLREIRELVARRRPPAALAA